jgi:hypothetical protein
MEKLKQQYGPQVFDVARPENGTRNHVFSGSGTSDVLVVTSSTGQTEWAARHTYAREEQYTIETIFGMLYPEEMTNQGADFTIYHERELYLNDNDLIEFIIHSYDDPTTDIYIWGSVWDEGQQVKGNPSSCPIDDLKVESGETPHEYYLNITTTGHYEIGVKNTVTGIWSWVNCNDSDNPSSYINQLVGSTEIYSTNPTPTFPEGAFSSAAEIRDDWTWDGDDLSYRPKVTFHWSHENTDDFVDVDSAFDASDRLHTYHLGEGQPS